MKLHRLLVPLTLTLAAPLLAQGVEPFPRLEIHILPYIVEFQVTTDAHPAFAVVLAALDPDLARYPLGLPPLLAEPVVLGIGDCGDAGVYTLALPETNFPTGIFVYVQGVVFSDVVTATEVGDFVLDVTAPQ